MYFARLPEKKSIWYLLCLVLYIMPMKRTCEKCNEEEKIPISKEEKKLQNLLKIKSTDNHKMYIFPIIIDDSWYKK